MQELVVQLIVVAAVVYLTAGWVKRRRRARSGEGSGCARCAAREIVARRIEAADKK